MDAVTVGAAVSMTKVLVPLPELPAASVWTTWTVYWALAGSAVTEDPGTDQVPLVTATEEKVCFKVPPVPEPAKILTVTVVASDEVVVVAVLVPAVPERAGWVVLT
jgi:hypothetical protein